MKTDAAGCCRQSRPWNGRPYWLRDRVAKDRKA